MSASRIWIGIVALLWVAAACGGEPPNGHQDEATSEDGVTNPYVVPTIRSNCPKTGWSDHVSSLKTAPSGCQAEYALGYTWGNYGDKVLWSCTVNTPRGPEKFTSTDRNCEGQGYAPISAYVGRVWNTGNSTRHPVYRCRTYDGEHFDSIASNCEGYVLEHMHGYMYWDFGSYR